MDWKRSVFALYAQVRADPDARAAWARWRAGRDALFATHPQSPIPPSGRSTFSGLDYFDYAPGLRVEAALAPSPPAELRIEASTGESFPFTQIATASFALEGSELALPVYWLQGYGGGILVPFRDATSGSQTYGAGRYVVDTVKGADLGMAGDRLVLDFNFAYNPSCAYDPRWACPLAPPDAWLKVPIRAGERTPST
jgi:uncharacterized protein